jgi:hypothetical protein
MLCCLNPNAAGVDIGATEIYIAVPADRDPQAVRCFATFTEDLHAAANWLKACNIETVAMESTALRGFSLTYVAFGSLPARCKSFSLGFQAGSNPTLSARF